MFVALLVFVATTTLTSAEGFFTTYEKGVQRGDSIQDRHYYLHNGYCNTQYPLIIDDLGCGNDWDGNENVPVNVRVTVVDESGFSSIQIADNLQQVAIYRGRNCYGSGKVVVSVECAHNIWDPWNNNWNEQNNNGKKGPPPPFNRRGPYSGYYLGETNFGFSNQHGYDNGRGISGFNHLKGSISGNHGQFVHNPFGKPGFGPPEGRRNL